MSPALLVYLSIAFKFFSSCGSRSNLCGFRWASQICILMFLLILENLDHYLLTYHFHPILPLLAFWNSTSMTASLFYNVPRDFMAPNRFPRGSAWLFLIDLSWSSLTLCVTMCKLDSSTEYVIEVIVFLVSVQEYCLKDFISLRGSLFSNQFFII